MQYLLAEARRLNVTIQSGTLPAGEGARYIHKGRRVIIDPRLGGWEAQRALAIALGHAHYGDTQSTPAVAGRAAGRARAVLVQAGVALLAAGALAASMFVGGTSASADPEPMPVAHHRLHNGAPSNAAHL